MASKADKFIITDLDHLFYEDMLWFLSQQNFHKNTIYKMRRTHIHRNNFKPGNYPGAGNIRNESWVIFGKFWLR